MIHGYNTIVLSFVTFEEYGIARAAWSYKQMDFGLIDDHYKDVYEELVKHL